MTPARSWIFLVITLLGCGSSQLPPRPDAPDGSPGIDGAIAAGGTGGTSVPAGGGAGGSPGTGGAAPATGGAPGTDAAAPGTGGSSPPPVDAGTMPSSMDAAADSASPAPCGAQDQACCADRTCKTSNLACTGTGAGTCHPCGAAGQPACPGNLCPGSACVSQDGICIAAGASCGARNDACNANGSCGSGQTACGGLDMPCCRGMGGGQAAKGICSAPGTTCAMPPMSGEARCQPCGAVGQPCCDDTYCRTGACKREDGSRMVCR